MIDKAFEQHRIWRETGDTESDRHWASGFLEPVSQAISTWPSKAGHQAGKLLKNLRDKAQQWCYCLEHPEVPPDNNLAERCLRTAVTKRKICGGSRSMTRFQQTANLLTVVQTCRLQGRSVIAFFEQALQHSQEHCPCPSLIPVPCPWPLCLSIPLPEFLRGFFTVFTIFVLYLAMPLSLAFSNSNVKKLPLRSPHWCGSSQQATLSNLATRSFLRKNNCNSAPSSYFLEFSILHF